MLRSALIWGRFNFIQVFFGFFRFLSVLSGNQEEFFGFFRFLSVLSGNQEEVFGFFLFFQETGRKPRGRKPPGFLKKPKETEKHLK